MREPFLIRCRAAGRDERNRRVNDSPHHGLVDVVIVSGPGKGKGVRLNWEAAKDFARALRDPGYSLRADSQAVVRVLHVGNGAVVVERRISDGFGSFFSLHPDPRFEEHRAREAIRETLLALANAITEAACHAEQDIPEVSEQVALDHATLARAGFPVGLTADPALLERARQLHDTDDELRRYLPSTKFEGVPTMRAALALPLPELVMGPADPAAALRARAEKMSLAELLELRRMMEDHARGD